MPRFFFWMIGLLIVFGAAGCAPAFSASPPTEKAVLPPTAESTLRGEVAATLTATPPEVRPEATVTLAVVEVTSRGPDLEATDPTTVQLASGGLQLIEFLRFT